MHVLILVRTVLIKLQLLNEQTDRAHALHEYQLHRTEVYEHLAFTSLKTHAKFVHRDMMEVLLLETVKLQVAMATAQPLL